MFYIIYKITNKINDKMYIGSHKTKTIEDNYMGSGKYLLHAQRKYGIENFTKEILFVFNTAEEMYSKEAELVNDDFISEENTYNLKRGGFGGFDYLNKNGLAYRRSFSDADREKARASIKLIPSAVFSARLKENKAKYSAEEKRAWSVAARTAALRPETQAKRLATLSDINHQQGATNSQYGTMWITDQIQNKKIKNTDSIPEGWEKGRKIK